MPSPERKLERQLVAYCKKHEIYIRKFVSPGHVGVPDRILMANGQVLFIELKSPGKKATAIQQREIGLINATKCAYACCENDWDVVRGLVDSYLLVG